MDAQAKFQKSAELNNSLLCVGLDPELKSIPNKFKSSKDSIFNFNKFIVDQTADLVCCFKPNIAFYEAYGLDGLVQLKKTIEYIQQKYPQIPIILDAKRADIGNTAKMYAKAVFDYWNVDAVTVYPHLGLDSLEPFFSYKNKLAILLIKTSNPDSGMFQDLETISGPYYLEMARKISNWKIKNFGLFVGATYPKQMESIRKLFPARFFLSAGVGQQGAEVKEVVKAGTNKNGTGIAFNASRSIIYSQNPRSSAQTLKDEINKYRKI